MEPEKSFYAVVPPLVSSPPPDRLKFPPAHLSVHQTKKEMFSRSNNEAKLVRLCEEKKNEIRKSPLGLLNSIQSEAAQVSSRIFVDLGSYSMI